MPEHPSESSIASLDDRILQAEQRLLERQRGIALRLATLRQSARQSMRPRRLLTPLLGAGLAGLLVGLSAWWLRRRSPRPALQRQAAAGLHGRSGAVGGLSWNELLLVAWPLLPSRWRTRMNPGTAVGLMALVPALLDRLRGRDNDSPPPATVVAVDLARYAGTWYEIARLPMAFERACAGQPTATYAPIPGDGGEIAVVNRCPGKGGGMRVARGIGQVVPGSGGAKLKVSLAPVWLRWLPLAWADYWVLFLDRDYRVALVGDPERRFLWVLARERSLPEPELQALLSLAQREGYPVQRVVRSAPTG